MTKKYIIHIPEDQYPAGDAALRWNGTEVTIVPKQADEVKENVCVQSQALGGTVFPRAWLKEEPSKEERLDQERERARTELRRRGYRVVRACHGSEFTTGDDLHFELFTHSANPKAPSVWFVFHDHGWDLFVQATASNEIVDTWAALDHATPPMPVDQETLDCEIWIGAISATGGLPQKGDKWVAAQYISTNSIGQRYVSPRGRQAPFYVAESAFRWTRKPAHQHPPHWKEAR